jgi:type II secretory pathway component PulM
VKLELPKVDFSKLLNWSSREWTLAAGGAIVLILFVFYFGFYRPKAAAVSELKRSIETAGKQAQAGDRSSASLSDLQKKVKGLEEKLRGAVGRMSGDIQLVQVLRQLATQSGMQKISVENIEVKEVGQTGGAASQKPGDKAKDDGADGKAKQDKPKNPMEIRTQKVEMTLHCSYDSAAQYLEALKELPAFLVVEELRVEREPVAFPNLKIFLTLRFHSVKELPQELSRS